MNWPTIGALLSFFPGMVYLVHICLFWIFATSLEPCAVKSYSLLSVNGTQVKRITNVC